MKEIPGSLFHPKSKSKNPVEDLVDFSLFQVQSK